jgi:hypothetical protein
VREDAATKARRLLVEGRLSVLRRDARSVIASCRGDSGQVYMVGHDGERGWRCDCEAMRSTCSHIKALQLVVVINRGRD